ncbi:hypothetical protein RIF29_09386 [Crotalaria pallida]|uniref:Uncharacterized protein n=1 Tax=Crotalaria pallida TaxID=3830 RepID=A0AAN9FY54_CROPI
MLGYRCQNQTTEKRTEGLQWRWSVEGGAVALGGGCGGELIRNKREGRKRRGGTNEIETDPRAVRRKLVLLLLRYAASAEELVADSHLLPTVAVGRIVGDQIREYVGSVVRPYVGVPVLETYG